MTKKYELIDGDTTTIGQTVLHRIKSLIAFDDVTIGQLGGYIESEDNLSHEGNCWVYDFGKVHDLARVSENGKVYGNAQMHGMSQLYGNAKITGECRIHDNVQIYDNAEIRGNTKLYNNVQVYGNGKVNGDSSIYGDTQIYEKAVIEGKRIKYDIHRCAEKQKDEECKSS